MRRSMRANDHFATRIDRHPQAARAVHASDVVRPGSEGKRLAQAPRGAGPVGRRPVSSQSCQIWSTVRLAAVFGSTIAACAHQPGSPSTAARTASSRGTDVGAVHGRALRRQVADPRRVGRRGRRGASGTSTAKPSGRLVIRPRLATFAEMTPQGAGLQRVDDLRRVLRGLATRSRAAAELASCSRTRAYSARFSALMPTYSPTFSRSRSTSLGWWRYHGTYSLECSLVSVG